MIAAQVIISRLVSKSYCCNPTSIFFSHLMWSAYISINAFCKLWKPFDAANPTLQNVRFYIDIISTDVYNIVNKSERIQLL